MPGCDDEPKGNSTMRYILGCLICLLAMGDASALSVEESYREISHRRTVFDPGTSRIAPAEARYLQQLFSAIDLAIVAKVSSMPGKTAKVDKNYANTWVAFNALRPPNKLEESTRLVRAAVELQQQYLRAANAMIKPEFNASDEKVRMASQHLQQAYRDWMRLYPNASPQAKQAFLDYSVALDFL